MMVPPLSILVPLYTMLVNLGGANTYWGIVLVLAAINMPLSVFLYTAFIRSIPVSVDEAGMIDGANRFTIFVRLHNFFPLFCACLTRAGGSVLPPATSADSQIFVRGLTKFSHAWQYPFALKYRKGTDRLAGAFAILRVAG